MSGGEKMITFACKTINKEDVVRCALDLNKTEYNVLNFFFKNQKRQITLTLSKSLGLKRTTIQKALKNLMKKKLIERKKETLKNGGYVFVYELKNKNCIKKRIKDTISKWHRSALEKIEKL